MKLTSTFFLFLFLCLNLSTAQAKLFKNSYVSFELPTNWKCKQEGFEHTCINAFSKKAKEAIIILTAKKKGSQDTLENYQAHLKTPRNMTNFKGAKYSSKAKAVRKRKINGVDWIDGIHLGSEVESYYSRYLATVKGSIGILVTFSAHKDHYTKYSNDFIAAIKSLKITASDDILNGGLSGKGKIRSGKHDIFDMSDNMPEGMYGEFSNDKNKGFVGKLIGMLGKRGLIGLMLLLLAGIGFYIFQKSR